MTHGLKLLLNLVPILLGVAAALWTPFNAWYDMKEGLIAFLGFLAASLVQVMPLTANFLQADRLAPSEAERLTKSLTNQQHYWLGLLTATIFTMVVVILSSALKGRLEEFPQIFEFSLFGYISWSMVMIFLISTCISFVFLKMLGLFSGILSLHRLRTELILSEAKRRASEVSDAIQAAANNPVPIVGDDYGKIVRQS